MERGRPGQTVYTFEAGAGVTMSYPDDELWTRDYNEARGYAQEKGYRVIGNDYEFEDSELIDDFTPAVECAFCGTVIEKVNRLYCDESPSHHHNTPDAGS
jgi:hypothetical protein